jgi:hypothetical protein
MAAVADPAAASHFQPTAAELAQQMPAAAAPSQEAEIERLRRQVKDLEEQQRQPEWPGRPPSATMPIQSAAAAMPAVAYDQAGGVSAVPPWFQQGGYPAGAQPQLGPQGQYPWPSHMMPYAGPWHGVAPGGPADWAAYMPADQRVAMPPSPRLQALSPRMQPCSPRMLIVDQAGMGMPHPGFHASAEIPAADDTKKESLLPCRPCKLNCKRRCRKPQCKCCLKGLPRCRCSCASAGQSIGRGMRAATRPCFESPFVKSGQWKQVVIIIIGLGSIGCLLAALLSEPPHLLAAGLASALGWLACYAYMLQRDCWRLARSLEADLAKQLSGSGEKVDDLDKSVEAVPPLGAGVDLDMTGLARSLGSPFCNGLGSVAPGKGKSGQTMQAVLTSALVNEYLRCASLLQKYQDKHGILPDAPKCNAGFAEALLVGLHGPTGAADANLCPPSPRSNVRSARPSFASSRSSETSEAPGSPPARASGLANEGTPNFADRLAAVNSDVVAQQAPQEGSPNGPARNNPFAESQRAAAVSSSSSSQNQSPANSLVPPPPAAAALERCPTIENASGAPFPIEASPDAGHGPAARVAARGSPEFNIDSSVNDPPWLRQAPHARTTPATDLDSSANDPPWLRQVRK